MSGERRIVYFLGAGASLGAGAVAKIQGGGAVAIPTQVTFWEIFLRFVKKTKNRQDIENFLFRYFLNYQKTPNRTKALARRKQLSPIDVEEVFTFLSERNNAPGVSPQLRSRTTKIWDALIEEIGQVFGRFPANKRTRSVYQRFKRQHLRSRDTIVSFNYDVVFEGSLPNSTKWYYEGIENDHESQSLRILKPHGSINWEEIEKEIVCRRKPSQYPEHPTVIAPTHLKFVGVGEPGDDGVRTGIGYLNQAAQIPDVWAAMEREMREAKAWVFIGYSFPSSDLYFASILRSTLATRRVDPYIVIVNPDSMAIRHRIQGRFSVSDDRIRTFPDLQTFNQIQRSQMLRMFQ
ncbi:hypothetical protein DW352_03260 [Pseudolabrys taiwanensis]|uniref:Uncharacterized protein n=1 Tax=Pseudolabrys taiwanensis TaxID=331696 RepID=A0A345ZRS5_9HYPH|nr:SIR2 family protein [Pseudolabrys taiwanensis]AXK79622.1 hypothetical protein DW352_03260 [Pseudolabrys taiwanensis]